MLWEHVGEWANIHMHVESKELPSLVFICSGFLLLYFGSPKSLVQS